MFFGDAEHVLSSPSHLVKPQSGLVLSSKIEEKPEAIWVAGFVVSNLMAGGSTKSVTFKELEQSRAFWTTVIESLV